MRSRASAFLVVVRGYDVSPWHLRPVPALALACVALAFCAGTPEGRPPDDLTQEIGPALVKRGKARREIIEESELK
jgi:hypothetical protein